MNRHRRIKLNKITKSSSIRSHNLRRTKKQLSKKQFKNKPSKF